MMSEARSQVKEATDKTIASLASFDLSSRQGLIADLRSGIKTLDDQASEAKSQILKVSKEHESAVFYIAQLGFLPFLILSIVPIIGTVLFCEFYQSIWCNDVSLDF